LVSKAQSTLKITSQYEKITASPTKYVSVKNKHNSSRKRPFEDIMNADSEQAIPLRQHVQKTVSRYLQDMGNTVPENLYQMLLAEIEPPLIEEILKRTGGNQSRAANMLGITRNTLRTKMQRYSINARSSNITRPNR